MKVFHLFRKIVITGITVSVVSGVVACKSTPEQEQSATNARQALAGYRALPPEVTLEEVKERCEDARKQLKEAQSSTNGREMTDTQKKETQELMKDCDEPGGSNDLGSGSNGLQLRTGGPNSVSSSKVPSVYSYLVNKDIAELLIQFFLTSQDFDLLDRLFQQGLKDGTVETVEIYIQKTRQ